MKILSGQIIFLIAIVGASFHLKQGRDSYYDSVALWIVLCGTISVGVMTSPIFKFRIVWNEFLLVFKGIAKNREEIIRDAIEFIRGRTNHLNVNKFEHRLMREGLELIQLGFSREKIKEVLEQRSINMLHDSNTIANWLRSLSKYPPAFGLIGTILGLINLMRGLSEGADPKQTGLSMAIALVATLYGLLTANLLINPLGERLKKNLEEKDIMTQVAIDAVLIVKDDANILEAQETLNSYLGLSSSKQENSFLEYETKVA